MKLKINYLLIVVILITIGVYLNYSINNLLNDISYDISNASIVNKIIMDKTSILDEEFINKDYSNPLDEIHFDGAKIYYWDFIGREEMNSLKRLAGWEDGNFYIKSVPFGAGLYIDIVVFKNNKPIFKREMISQGRAFIGWRDNYLNIIEGKEGEDDGSCCPSEWVLTRYKYNSETNILDEVETKIYAGGEIKPIGPNIVPIILYPYTNYPKELEDFEEDNTIEVFEL